MPYATNDGVRIRYEVEGSGPPLVLHIGYIGGLEDWADAGYVAPLARGFRVLRLDPRGQGQSDKPHDPAKYGPEMAADVVRLLDQSAGEIVETAKRTGAKIAGPIPLPTKINKYCVLRSPRGWMEGSYRFVRPDGTAFEAAIPRFALDAGREQRA